jgi:nicotinamide mononucleotide (NMN) deamidase PncC
VRASVVGDQPDATPDAARTMATAARRELGADVGIGITSLDGARPPAVSAHLCVLTPTAERSRTLTFDAPVAVLRARIPTVALHLLRQAIQA